MKWLVLFLSIPIIEIFLFLKINQLIGILYTLSIIMITALIGLFFVKMQAREIFFTFKTQNLNPMLFFSHGLLIFTAGIFLLTPGFITDTIGFFLLIPNLRLVIITIVAKKLNQNKGEENSHW